MKWNLCLILIMVCSTSFAQVNKAAFSFLEYRGKDAHFDGKINSEAQYRNPILSGMYPDPSICRRGDDYFLIHSSFSYFPGIPIFHSKDLVNWVQIGHVLDRPEQLSLKGLGMSAGVYAPAIEYNEQNQTFYVINTVVGGIGNFIVKTKDPFKGWSNPIALGAVKGIDPSIFVDEDGQGYIVCSQASPQPRWSGHTVIWMHKFDFNSDQASDERLLLIDGGPDTAQHPRWLEGPHLYKEKGYYYLIAAEGGTQSGHKEVVFRSRHVAGPYVPGPHNPILTQLGLPDQRADKITNVGHADMIKTPEGDWWAVFLGCRPYADDQFNTGRETFLLPVQWVNEFPVILEKGAAVPVVGYKKGLQPIEQTLTGNFTWRDDFTQSPLGMKWNTIRTPQDHWWKIEAGALQIEVAARSLRQQVNPAFWGIRQQHLTFEVETLLDFDPRSDAEMAGMAYVQNEQNYLVLGKAFIQHRPVVVLQGVKNGIHEVLAKIDLSAPEAKQPLRLRIVVREGKADFLYGLADKASLFLLAKEVDITHLSTKKAKGFIGAYVGLYATSLHY
jgi:alpha-N-arabinofuranosidase